MSKGNEYELEILNKQMDTLLAAHFQSTILNNYFCTSTSCLLLLLIILTSSVKIDN